MLYQFKNELVTENKECLDGILNKHMLNMKDIDFTRKEHRADFHLKQKEVYIDQLKKQLELRDQLIKEKLGTSATIFLKNEMLTVEEIENIDSNFVLPDLGKTKVFNMSQNSRIQNLE